MPTKHFDRRVFVDFENVPAVDLSLIEGRSIHVTLLIGKKQTKLELALVQQLRRLPEQVELVEVGASGRNALDLTLAYHLGRAAQCYPEAHFTIVSKDKDFEPLLGHLKTSGFKADRHETFASVFPKAARKPEAVAKPTARKQPVDRLEKLIARLRNSQAPRPKKKASLLAHINTALGNKLDEAGKMAQLDELTRRGILVIEEKDKVRYL